MRDWAKFDARSKCNPITVTVQSGTSACILGLGVCGGVRHNMLVCFLFLFCMVGRSPVTSNERPDF